MTDTERTETDQQDRNGRKGNLLLLGAVGLILIPVLVGWFMANTDSGGDEDGSQSGMGGSTAGDFCSATAQRPTSACSPVACRKRRWPSALPWSWALSESWPIGRCRL